MIDASRAMGASHSSGTLSPLQRKTRPPRFGDVRRAPRAFGLFLPGRRLASGGGGAAGGRARLRGPSAHRPRRGLRLARVRPRGEDLRRARDHRGGGDARRRRARHPARRGRARLREPLPPADRGARGHEAQAGGPAAPACAGAAPARGTERRARLPVRLRPARPRRRRPQQRCAARARVRPRALPRRAPAAVRARRRAPERRAQRPRGAAGRADGRDRGRARAPSPSSAAAGRARRHPRVHLARRFGARAAR